MFMIQLIEKQNNTFHLSIMGKDYYFIPPTYITDNFLPLTVKVKGSTLGWNIGGKFISYWQIKKAIKHYN